MKKDNRSTNRSRKENDNNQGDSISTGNIDGSNVAIGRGASVTMISSGNNIEQTRNIFTQMIKDVSNLEGVGEVDKGDAIAEIEGLKEKFEQDELTEDFLSRRLRNIGRMSEDILDVVTKTLLSPAAGLAEVAQKIIFRVRQEFNLGNQSQ